MSANFNPAADAWLSGTAGASGPAGSGAYTIAVLYRPAANNCGLVNLRAGGVEVRSLLQDVLKLFGASDFSSGDATAITAANWWLGAQTKPAGAQLYRHHAWLYDAGGAGSMTHAVSTGSANHGDGAAIDNIRIGWASNRGNGDVAVVGIWGTALSDGQLDTLKSPNLSAWAALSPLELITFDTWNGATGWTTKVGTSSLSSITGTVGVGTNPPSFVFTLGSSATLTPATFAFSGKAVTATPQPVTVALTPSTFTFSAKAVTAIPVGPVTVALTPAGFAFTGAPLGLPGGGQNFDWCADLVPNWDAALHGANWDARLMSNWTAELVEGCS